MLVVVLMIRAMLAEVLPRGVVGFSSRNVGGDGAREDEGRRLRRGVVWVRLAVGVIGAGVEAGKLGLELGVGVGKGLGLDEGGETVPETRGANTVNAGEVGKVLLAPHLKHLLTKLPPPPLTDFF